MWEELFPAERARLMRLLVERVSFDAATSVVEVKLRGDGVAELGGAA